jgi:hypothetical protein
MINQEEEVLMVEGNMDAGLSITTTKKNDLINDPERIIDVSRRQAFRACREVANRLTKQFLWFFSCRQQKILKSEKVVRQKRGAIVDQKWSHSFPERCLMPAFSEWY